MSNEESVDTSQDELRPDLIRDTNEAIIKVRDIVSQLSVREKDHLRRHSPVYRQLVDSIKSWYEPVHHVPPACRYDVVTCVYCGHEYPAGTQTSGAQILTDHIRQCEKHPMKKVSDDRDILRKALVGLVGANTREELDAMEVYIRSVPAPDEDKMTAINGIHALIKTLSQEN